jgi:hypothetical protein
MAEHSGSGGDTSGTSVGSNRCGAGKAGEFELKHARWISWLARAHPAKDQGRCMVRGEIFQARESCPLSLSTMSGSCGKTDPAQSSDSPDECQGVTPTQAAHSRYTQPVRV